MDSERLLSYYYAAQMQSVWRRDVVSVEKFFGGWGMKTLIMGVAVTMALSATSGIATAAVYKPEQQLPATVTDGFKSNPAGLLTQYPNGGAQLIQRVRDLAASDPSTLPLIANLLKTPLAAGQQSAIVTGLAQAARLASATDPAYYNEIQTAVAGAGNKEAADQYASITGNAATGAGAGGGGAGGGGGGGGSGGGGQVGSSGIIFGGSNSGGNQTVARSYTTQMTPTSSGSVGGLSTSVSPR